MTKKAIAKTARMLAQKTMQENGPIDVVHGHFALQGYAASSIADWLGIPFIYTEHCSLAMKGDERYCTLAREVCAKANQVIAVSTVLSKIISPWCKSNPLVVWNVVDTNVFSSCIRREHHPFRFVCTGSLNARKRQGLLIKAFAALRAKHEGEGIELVIIGSGPDEAALKDHASRCGYKDDVIFTGKLSRERILEWFEESDCFVLPSALETFGVAYAEALCAGLPVISTKCGGPEDFITPECGVLVPVDDVKALVEAMDEVFSREASFNEAFLREYAYNSFSPEAIAAELISVYDGAVAASNLKDNMNTGL